MLKKVCITLLLATTLAGCSTLNTLQSNPQTQLAAQLATYRLTSKVIDDRQDKAVKVRRYALQVIDVIDSEAETTVELLSHYVQGKIDWDNVKPDERIVIEAFIEALEKELTARVGVYQLNEQDKVNVKQVLQWVVEAAEAEMEAGDELHSSKI